MKPNPTALYLELMKKTLCFLLWEEPARPIELFNYRRPPLKAIPINVVSNLLRTQNLQVVKHHHYDEKVRVEGNIWPLVAHTMIGYKGLDNIQYCVETILKDGVPGDFIETGVWRGGACIFMRAILAAYGIEDRRVFVADSFAGLPKPDEEAYPQDTNDKHHTHDFLMVSEEQVKENFRKYDLLDEQVVFLKGWFKDTLPTAPIESLALMRLDGDMYESTMDALNSLYFKLSEGGFCIIDDYGLKGCRAAVDDFRQQHNIKSPIEPIKDASVYWRK